MKKVMVLVLTAAVLWFCSVLSDRQQLGEDLIRLHVVGASDSEEDQAVKLKVRDAVIGALEGSLGGMPSREEAEEWLQDRLSELEELANRVLAENGSRDRATVSLMEEEFPTRVYDTFTLPAGIYHSLRIKIGAAEGKNWWCVVFPSLCYGAASDFEEAAACGGFSEELTAALEGETGYEVRFFVLDALGRLENLLHRG